MPYCNGCGHSLPYDAKFCLKCGNPVSEATVREGMSKSELIKYLEECISTIEGYIKHIADLGWKDRDADWLVARMCKYVSDYSNRINKYNHMTDERFYQTQDGYAYKVRWTKNDMQSLKIAYDTLISRGPVAPPPKWSW